MADTAAPAAVKPKVAFYWCASCGGCEEAVVDLAEAILDVVGAVDIAFWPVALDFKRHDVEAMDDGALLASFVNGAIRTTEQAEMALLLRQKSQLLIAFGACAHLGGIPGLANLWDRESIFRQVYAESPSTENPSGVVPQVRYEEDGRALSLPGFYDTVRTLDQVVPVDYYLPGCPPTPKIIVQAVQTLLSGALPPPGVGLAPDRALGGRGNRPCSGFVGPTSRVRDHGGKALSAIASIVASNDAGEIERILAQVPDPIGTLYRYSLPSSLLRRRRREAAAAQGGGRHGTPGGGERG